MKPGRKSLTTMKPEFGVSRKARIAALIGSGMTLPACWRAMEAEYPQTIKDDSVRKELCLELGIISPAYDAVERDNLGKAIRQVKGLMIKENAELETLLEEVGAGDAKSPDQIEFVNRKRFDSGLAGFNYIYGQTIYMWLVDDPDGNYGDVTFMKKLNGVEVEKTERMMLDGRYKKGDWVHKDQGVGDNWVATVESDAIIEHGMPESFLSLWGGSPGVGKTRLAIALCKALNKSGYGTLYFNGEADPQDFRGWLGADVDSDLFRLVSGEMIRTEKAVEQIYKYRPRVVIVDSIQMLAEAKKGRNGEIRAMSVFKQLKSDDDAGNPHIIFISQLNKKEELAGSRYLEHMVDFAARAVKVEGRIGEFMFECPRKNRGGPTPRRLRFKHTSGTVLCTSTGMNDGPLYKYIQQTDNPVLINGILPPAF